MADAVIEVRDLRKRYGDAEAVRGISFSVEPGEVFALIGPNGSGKTTTIEILEGYRPRTSGDVRVFGVDPERAGRGWRERVGLVLQECALEPTLTVAEMLHQFADLYRAPRDVDETLELVGLGDERKARVGTLSGGQRRRVDVALGLIGDPDLLFLDEPTTGFDPTARHEAWQMIEGLRALGKTIFLTTHYMDEAEHLATRVVILRRGEIVGQGSPSELAARAGALSEIRFRTADSVDRVQLGEITGLRFAGAADGEVVATTPDPQEALTRLLAWARVDGIRLEGIEVRRPTLEDLFLTLTEERR